MTILTPTQIANLRKRPQSTKLFLSIYQPKTIFQTRVTGSYNQGDLRISYYGTTTGSYQNIYSNLCARIGSTPGAQDIGELRVRSATGTYIDFAENEVVWQQGMYLTLIDYINVEAIYPRIIQDPANPTNVIFYKDYDIPYSNQNTIYGTFPCAGPHRAGFIVTGAYSTYWSSTGSYNVRGDTLTYSWAFEGGTPTGSTAKDPGIVNYTVPGHYKTRLIITSSSGAIDTTYRYVSVYQKPNQGTFNPIEAWEMDELSGSRNEGGYTARMKIMAVLPELEPHALVVIFAEDSYGGNNISLGGNSQNNESIVFVGYVLKDTIKFNYEQSTMEFEVGSVSEIMKEAEGFSVSCESKATATTWYELQEMTIQKALYHYLRWHSTTLNVNDFQYTNDDRYMQYFDSDRESVFDAVDNFMRNGLLGSLIADRQGKLWAQISHYGLQTPFSDIPVSMALNKQDWMGDPTIEERRDSDVSFVELGGIAYYGVSSNTFSALLSNAPGITPLYHGKTERQEGLVLLSQAQLNQVAANYLAFKNTSFPEVSLSLNGNYRNIDIAPQEQLFLVIAPQDTIRNVSLQGNPYQALSMNWRYSSTHQTFLPDLVLESMATGTMAESVFIPAVPPYQNSGFDYPSLQLPTLPVFNPPSAVGPTSPMRVILHDQNVGLLYSDDFDSVNPHWRTINAGLTATQYQNINKIVIAPNGGIYVARQMSTNLSSGPFIAYAPSVGSTFTVIEDVTSIAAKLPGFTSHVAVNAIGVNLLTNQIAYMISGDDGGIGNQSKFYLGTATTFTNTFTTTALHVNSNGSLSFGGNNWRLTATTNNTSGQFLALDAGLTSIIRSVNYGSFATTSKGHLYATTSDVVVIRKSGGVIRVTANGAVAADFTTVFGSGLNAIDPWDNYSACDADAMFMMSSWDVGTRGRTSDGGATWVGIPNLPVGGNYAYGYAGGTNTSTRWIAANGIVRFSPDWGYSWQEKGGNLISFAPIPAIDIVKAIGY